MTQCYLFFDAYYICDLLSENPALPANIEFEFEAILSRQVVFQIITLMFFLGGLHCIILNSILYLSIA